MRNLLAEIMSPICRTAEAQNLLEYLWDLYVWLLRVAASECVSKCRGSTDICGCAGDAAAAFQKSRVPSVYFVFPWLRSPALRSAAPALMHGLIQDEYQCQRR